MKLAVLSDMHGNLVAFEAALADLESVGEVDMVWVLGDLALMGPRPAECVRRVMKLRDEIGEKKVEVIGGNTDRYLVTGQTSKNSRAARDEENFNKLYEKRVNSALVSNWTLKQLDWETYEFMAKTLHRETSLKAEGYGYVVGYHAIPGDDESGALMTDTPDEEAADALLDREGRLGIGGHIHQQMDRDLGLWRAVNVGSVGFSVDMPGKAQWGLFTFDKGEVTVDLRAVAYDVEAAIADFAAVGHPAPDTAIKAIRGEFESA